MSDDTEFNDYFINIAVDLKEPIQNIDLSKLKHSISSKVPDDLHFELPDNDENFVFRILSTLDGSKVTGLVVDQDFRYHCEKVICHIE